MIYVSNTALNWVCICNQAAGSCAAAGQRIKHLCTAIWQPVDGCTSGPVVALRVRVGSVARIAELIHAGLYAIIGISVYLVAKHGIGAQHCCQQDAGRDRGGQHW